MTEVAVEITHMEEKGEERGALLQLVSVPVGAEEFAIEILGVQEIIQMVALSPVANAQHVVEGVIHLRGKVIPIFDLRAQFGLPAIERTKDRGIIVVDTAHTLLWFIVDSVEEVLRLPEELIERLRRPGEGDVQSFIKVSGELMDDFVMCGI